jgi:c-di-GMP-binding flagellar brake protein YcgR
MASLEKENYFEERRKFPRLNLAVDIEYSVLQKEPSLKVEVQSKNLSSGGICLIVYEKVKVGDSLALVMKLPEGERPIQAKGIVKWIGEFILSADNKSSWDVGVEFVGITETDREKLSQYVFRFLNQK